jgi:RimJ/RimL family protein N-acetyltransferase
MASTKSFETKRLILKPTTAADAAMFFELYNTPKWIKYVGDINVQTIADAKEIITKKTIPHRKKYGYASYTVIRKSDKVKIGSCGLLNREGQNGVDVGCAFLPQYEGKGYALESLIKLIEVAVREFKLSRINAMTFKKNKDAQKLLQKLGFEFEKVTTLPNVKGTHLLYKWSKQKCPHREGTFMKGRHLQQASSQYHKS